MAKTISKRSSSRSNPPTVPVPKGKRGRKAAHYRTSWGDVVNGLALRPSDGRWRIIGTSITFSESDERMAVARFRSWQAKQQARRIDLAAGLGTSDPSDPIRHLASAFDRGVKPTIHADRGGKTSAITFHQSVDEDALYAWFRQQLLTNPKRVAERTGIEQLAYLTDLTPPPPSPSLEAIGKLYFSTARITEKERRESQGWWEDFAASMKAKGLTTAADLTPAAVAEWGDSITVKASSPTYVRHRFGKIKTVLRFAQKRGHPVRSAIDATAILELPKAASTDPKPIDRDDLHKLLEASKRDKRTTADRTLAAILCMLNFAMYPSEVTALRWEELDLSKGTLVTARNKTGVVRVAVIWQRTIDALHKLDRSSPYVFRSGYGNPLSVATLRDDWTLLRSAAKVPHVEMNQLRDGAYTSAIEGGASLDVAQMLAGHRTGIADHYLRRRPTMVADACKAIEHHYFA